jgi:hypothetical protein
MVPIIKNTIPINIAKFLILLISTLLPIVRKTDTKNIAPDKERDASASHIIFKTFLIINPFLVFSFWAPFLKKVLMEPV